MNITFQIKSCWPPIKMILFISLINTRKSADKNANFLPLKSFFEVKNQPNLSYFFLWRISTKRPTFITLVALFIHTKKSRQLAFFYITRFEIFPKKCILTYKMLKKYHTSTFIVDHTVIGATRAMRFLKKVSIFFQMIPEFW